MCDCQVLITRRGVYFGKSSDREPGEPQLVERLPAVRGDRSPRVRATWVEIDQTTNRHGVILSRPAWMWGGEMGANERGVVIGNEAVFTRVMQRRPALLGMALVRLGLERGDDARHALAVITGMLERHGQGGPAGFRDRRFHYDNSFLIADAREAWVLETADRHWAARRVRGSAAISNCLTIGSDYDLCSPGLTDFARVRGLYDGRGELHFARASDSRLLPRLARAPERLARSVRDLAQVPHGPEPGLGTMVANLSRHASSGDADADPARGTNRDLCMHAGGPVRRHQTTGSQVSALSSDGAVHLFTGTSAPCLSVYRPVGFEPGKSYSVLEAGRIPGEGLWRRHERVHRRALFDPVLRAALRDDRAEAVARILALLDGPAVPGVGDLWQADAVAADWQRRQERRAASGRVRYSRNLYGLWWRWLDRRGPDGVTEESAVGV